MTMVQLTSINEDELCLLLYLVNVKFPSKLPYEITRDMLLSYNVKYIVEHIQRIVPEIKDEYKPLLEQLFLKVTHELEHIIELPVLPEPTNITQNENTPPN